MVERMALDHEINGVRFPAPLPYLVWARTDEVMLMAKMRMRPKAYWAGAILLWRKEVGAWYNGGTWRPPYAETVDSIGFAPSPSGGKM